MKYAAGAVVDASFGNYFLKDSGIGPENSTLTAFERQLSSAASGSVILGWRERLKSEAIDVATKRVRPGWADVDSDPISLESLLATISFIDLLPEGIVSPEIVPEPDGELALEWSPDRENMLSISISGSEIHYAGLFPGGTKQYGKERFFRDIPATVLELIKRFAAA